nr:MULTISPECIES: Dna2/Cas4 domain-containing protein [Streptomyces]
MTAPHPPARGEGELTQVSLSSLEHYAYCARQAGLILLEQTWTDDAATVRGTLLHQRVDTPGNHGRGTVRTLHALPVWHDDHGLTGVCDTVELHADPSGATEDRNPKSAEGAVAMMVVAVALRGD